MQAVRQTLFKALVLLQSGSQSCAVSLAKPQHSSEHPVRPSSPSVFSSRLPPSMNAGGFLCCFSSEAFFKKQACISCLCCIWEHKARVHGLPQTLPKTEQQGCGFKEIIQCIFIQINTHFLCFHVM